MRNDDLNFIAAAVDFSDAGPDKFKPGYDQYRDLALAAQRVANATPPAIPERGEAAIPEDMVPWSGGEVPTDWNGGAVLLADGEMFTARFQPLDWGRPAGLSRKRDIIAYTPRPAASRPDVVDRLEAALRIAQRTLHNYADPTGYSRNDDEPYLASDDIHPGKLAEISLVEIDEILAIAALCPDTTAASEQQKMGKPEPDGGET